MWPTQHGKLVGRRYGGASGRATDLAQVRPIPQESYGRPNTGKANTFTCRRIPHRKDDGRGGSVRRQETSALQVDFYSQKKHPVRNHDLFRIPVTTDDGTTPRSRHAFERTIVERLRRIFVYE
ncbi:hypothetical protein BHE74_00013537 [Ensete ventricosum]|nr:hypothetical protein BHE74_00013537 [Ensete ventricosum]